VTVTTVAGVTTTNTAEVNSYTDTTNDMFGLSASHDFGSAIFGVNYVYSIARSKYNETNAANSTGLSAANLTALANGNYPDMTTETNSLDLNVLVPLSKNVSTRIGYRYDTFKVTDWHYDGLTGRGSATGVGRDAGTGATVWSDLGPHDYKINTLSLLLGVKL
jgi:hypothetical protein